MTPRAANCAEPAKTSADISTAAHPGNPAAMARTPKDRAKTKTASARGATVMRISLTDRRLAGVKERPGKAEHLRVGRRVVRRVAARDEQRVELVGANLVDRGLGLCRSRALLPLGLLAGSQPDDRDLVTRLLERVIGLL